MRAGSDVNANSGLFLLKKDTEEPHLSKAGELELRNVMPGGVKSDNGIKLF